MFEDCRAYWKFDEASDYRYDSVGPFDLFDYGSHGNVAGVVGAALQMPVSALAYMATGGLTVAYPRLCQDFTLVGWYRHSAPREADLIFHCSISNGSFSIIRLLCESNQFVFDCNGPSCYSVATAATFGAIPNDTWVFVACRWNATTGVARISVNAGASDSGTSNGPGDDSEAQTTSLNFSNQEHSSTIDLDDVAFFSRELSEEEITTLYESEGGLAALLPSVASAGRYFFGPASLLGRPLQHV